MEIRDLRSIIGIAETGSLSAAARKLNLTQPALSASLRRLEDELGVKLVTRHSRGSVLSEEGKYVLERAYSICNDVADLASVVENLAIEPSGKVHLGLPTTVAGGIIPELYLEMEARYPHVKLHIVEAMSGVLAELLQLGRLDLAVLFDVQPMPGLRSEPILKERHYLLVSPKHALAYQPSIRLEEVAGIGLVLPSSQNSIRQYLESKCAEEGVALNVTGDIDSLPGLINLVRAGYSTILPLYVVRDAMRDGSIVAIEIREPVLEWTVHLASRHDTTRPRASLATGHLLIEACVNQSIKGIWPSTPVKRG